jgi:hypothetical protein
MAKIPHGGDDGDGDEETLPVPKGGFSNDRMMSHTG